MKNCSPIYASNDECWWLMNLLLITNFMHSIVEGQMKSLYSMTFRRIIQQTINRKSKHYLLTQMRGKNNVDGHFDMYSKRYSVSNPLIIYVMRDLLTADRNHLQSRCRRHKIWIRIIWSYLKNSIKSTSIKSFGLLRINQSLIVIHFLNYGYGYIGFVFRKILLYNFWSEIYSSLRYIFTFLFRTISILNF